jgi:hypothetical protein
MSETIRRLALPQDVGGIYRLIENIYTENKEELDLGDIDRENIIRGISNTVNKNMVLIIEKENQIIASIGMKLEKSLLGKNLLATDYWVYCVKEHRSMNIFKVLLKFAVHISKLNSVKLVMNISSTVDTERKIKLYESIGFKQIGGSFLYVRE